MTHPHVQEEPTKQSRLRKKRTAPADRERDRNEAGSAAEEKGEEMALAD